MATSMGSNVGGGIGVRLDSEGSKPLGWGKIDHGEHRVKIKKGWNHILHIRGPRGKVRQGAINSSRSD
jgi:hypothetical protein